MSQNSEDPKTSGPSPGRETDGEGSVVETPLKLFSVVGPGIITGAADDDPSGIATYTIAGAQNNMSLLWLAWVTWPLMAGVQMMCARIGMMTGRGLTENLSAKLPRPIVMLLSVALLIANLVNIAADLSGMGDAMKLLTGGPSYIFVAFFGICLTAAVIRFRYAPIENVLKWLTVTLLAYVVTPFILHAHWGEVFRATIAVGLPSGPNGWSTVVAILGTTISPYLFVWQTAQEIEDSKIGGRLATARRQGAPKALVRDRILDVGFGTLISNIVMFFVMLTAAMTLGAHGVNQIETSQQAAEALGPLAGPSAAFLYTAGLVAVGLLAIPTLAGSSAYAFAEIFGWSQGLDRPFGEAKSFYMVIAASTLGGVLLNLIQINPVKAMLWSAIVNGVAAPVILLGVLLVASDRQLMNGKPSSRLNLVVVGLTTLAMFGAAIGLLF